MAIARSEGKEEGRVEGKLDTLVELVKKGLLTVAQVAEEAQLTVSEFKAKTNL